MPGNHRCLDSKYKIINLGQFRDFGTVPEARDSPGTLGMLQRPRVSWKLGQSLDVGTVQKTQSPNTMGVISQTKKPKSLGQSRAFGTVPETRDSPNFKVLTLDVGPSNHSSTQKMLGNFSST